MWRIDAIRSKATKAQGSSMFVKWEMRDVGNGRLFEYVIIEGYDAGETHDIASSLPESFGEVISYHDDGPVEVVSDPLKEPWPIFSEAYFKRLTRAWQEEQKAKLESLKSQAEI